jgi:putative Holliday junction resolvase
VTARIIGLDAGERRIGVAVSDPEGRLAVPVRIIDARDEPAAFDEIAALARDEGAGAIVVGHPLSMSGSAGPQARRVEALAERLRDHTGLPVELQDERLSSVEVARAAPPGRKRRARPERSRRGKPAPQDDLAAAAILQRYLDRQRSQQAAQA